MTSALPFVAERLLDGPIIDAESHPSIGTNIQGPSAVEMPEWAVGRLGRFHLYFADHKGRFIRLAFADEVTGPWRIHEPGSLRLADSRFPTERLELDDDTFAAIEAHFRSQLGDATPSDLRSDLVEPHIASPDVHVDHERRELVMYFHGLDEDFDQRTRVATSADGVTFAALPDLLGPSYFRCFRYGDWWYALAMPGLVLRSRDGRTNFEGGPQLFSPSMRHCAVRRRGDTLDVFWTQVGDAPEQILWSTIDLTGDWLDWSESGAVPVLAPEEPWEGAEVAVAPSIRGAVYQRVRQLRDPALLDVDGRTYLFYAVAGESGIALAELVNLCL